MKFGNLVINEIIKILKRKYCIVFLVISIISIVLSSILVNNNFDNRQKVAGNEIVAEYDVDLAIFYLKNEITLTKTSQEKNFLEEKLKIYEYIKDEGPSDILNAGYKKEILSCLFDNIKILLVIDKNLNEQRYNKVLDRVNIYWEFLLNGTFEESLKYQIKEIEEEFYDGNITEKEYDSKIKYKKQLLEYEIGKYSYDNRYDMWKFNLIEQLGKSEQFQEGNIYYNNGVGYYVTKEKAEKIKNEGLISEYRLRNNLKPTYNFSYSIGTPEERNTFCRYAYNYFSNNISTFIISIFIIIVSVTTISEEFSKGTIKSLLVVPYKRYKILLSKILSVFIIFIITFIIISNISILFGNLMYGVDSNNFLYVNNNQVKEMPTYLYEFLQFLLKIPEIILFMILGMTIATLSKNTVISTVITTIFCVGNSTIFNILNRLHLFEYLKYLPFTNLNFVDRVFPIPNYVTSDMFGYEIVRYAQNSISVSVLILIITVVLLLITLFSSFNRKDI